MKHIRETLQQNKILIRKVVDSGDFIEVYNYKQPRFIHTRLKSNPKKPRGNPRPESLIFNQKRAKKTIRRLLALNFTENAKFVTLTFVDNVVDMDFAKNEFKKFCKRLRYRNGESFNYICVPEFQRRGAIHFHVVMEIPYIRNSTLFELWGNGFVRINKVKNKEHLVNYVSKYMNKNYIDNRLLGYRMFTCSRGLARPLVLFDSLENRVATSYLKKIEFNGIVDYSSEFDKVPEYGLQYWYISKENINEANRIIYFFQENYLQEKLEKLLNDSNSSRG